MPSKFYRLKPPDDETFGVLKTMAELAESIFSEKPSGKPASPYHYEAEWLCWNENFDIVRVRVEVFHDDGRKPKKRKTLRCPNCGEPMEFRHYLRTQTLVPVSTIAN